VYQERSNLHSRIVIAFEGGKLAMGWWSSFVAFRRAGAELWSGLREIHCRV